MKLNCDKCRTVISTKQEYKFQRNPYYKMVLSGVDRNRKEDNKLEVVLCRSCAEKLNSFVWGDYCLTVPEIKFREPDSGVTEEEWTYTP